MKVLSDKIYFCRKYVIVSLTTILYVLSVSLFLTPHGFLPGGVNGLALLFVKIFGLAGIELNRGLLVFILNLPLLVLAYKGLSKNFLMLTLLSITIQSIGFSLVNFDFVILDDLVASGLIGGGLVGVASGLCLKYGASTGGVDILSQYLSFKKNRSIGGITLMNNFLILFLSSLFFPIEIAIYTGLGYIASSIMVNKIHTSYSYVRVEIVTKEIKDVKSAILDNYIHGITIYDTEGGYSGERRKVLVSVCYNYEVTSITRLVLSIDPKAFITMSPVRIYSGNFVKKTIG